MSVRRPGRSCGWRRSGVLLHPGDVESGFVTWSPTGLPGLCPRDEALGGAGTPLVAAFSPEPFAAALGISTLAGMQLLADALDLQHRLPRLWAAVEALAVAPWKARQIAQATHRLSAAGAGYVDTHLADRVSGYGWAAVERLIAQAIATFDPDLLAAHERAGKAAWDVTLTHRGPTTGTAQQSATWAGTSHLQATGDTLDLTRLYDLVLAHATHLKALGDPDPLGARKAKALGLIAEQHPTLDLTTHPATSGPEVTTTTQTRSRTKSTLYLHLTLTDLLGLDHPSGAPGPGQGQGPGFGSVERLGPATLARIKDWVAHTQVSIRPVLDLGRTDTCDAHDPPGWLRELVVLRDPHCVFPWCTRHSRACDLDHIDPYQEHGPPGQTRPENLAPLCRRHHRAKTHRRWAYHRTPTGAYHWTGPHARTYLVTPTGTHALPPD